MDQALDSLRLGQAGSVSAGPSSSAALTLLQYPQFLWITERSPSNRITLVVQPMAPASVTQFSYCSIEKNNAEKYSAKNESKLSLLTETAGPDVAMGRSQTLTLLENQEN
ncbi:hypothetical protein MHYP_G00066880 [Metynnis hypsauchen]